MPFSEQPISVMFVIFLLIFLLGGIAPVWKEVSAKYKRLLRERQGKGAASAAGPATAPVILSDPVRLDDHERFVLRHLAQTPRKGVSPRRLAADLHFAPQVVRRSLQSLVRRGLIEIRHSLMLFGVKASLSKAGQRFAREQGYIVRLEQRG